MKLFKKPIVLLVLFCLLEIHLCAQDNTGLEQQLENINEQSETEVEDDGYLQQLQHYLLHPLNINTATENELQELKMLHALQIQNLLDYRKLLGNFIDVYELQAVPAWDVATIKKVLPFITLRENEAAKILSRFGSGDQWLLLRAGTVLEKAKGYNSSLNNHYAGSRLRVQTRYKYQFKNLLQYGFVADKDAGEQFFKGAQKWGFDFYSFHLFARNMGILKSLAIGDFAVNMGQGLVQWQSLAFKKSAETMAVMRQSPVLVPYQSAGEFYFNRGVGATFKKGAVETTLFASLRHISANTATDTLLGEAVFTSFAASGLHRTANEIKDKNAVLQTSFGTNISYEAKGFKIGFNGIGYHFSKALQKQDAPYNLFAISGNHWYNASVDYHGVFKNIYFFGEAAVAQNNSTAFINGLLASVHPKVDVSVVQRYIAARYQTLYGNAFTESILPANEHGFYLGLTVRPVTQWRLNAYADFFNFPWLRYRTDAPGAGQEYLLMATYVPNKATEMYIRYRYDGKSINETGVADPLNFIVQKYRQNLRWHLSRKINNMVFIKSRVEVMWFDKKEKDAEEGFLFYVEGSLKMRQQLSANARLQYFETNGYNSRIYVYETDLPYSYSVPSFFNRGFRYYATVNYGVFKKLDISLRWAQSIYKNTASIGTALDMVNGNKLTDVKLQASYRF